MLIRRRSATAKMPSSVGRHAGFQVAIHDHRHAGLQRYLPQRVEKVDGEFVDIWDGFVDENGAFVYTGPDINGQPVRLRGADDGINVTKAGKRKIAFYAEKSLRRLLGDAARPGLRHAGQRSLPELTACAAKIAAIDPRHRPLRLTDPALDGGADLLGDRQAETLPGRATNWCSMACRSQLASPGRADDFACHGPIRSRAGPGCRQLYAAPGLLATSPHAESGRR